MSVMLERHFFLSSTHTKALERQRFDDILICTSYFNENRDKNNERKFLEFVLTKNTGTIFSTNVNLM